MHDAGRNIMETHPICLEFNPLVINTIIKDLQIPVHLGYELTSKLLSEFCGYSLYITPIDGELPGIGVYIFFENEEDAMEFKLKWL